MLYEIGLCHDIGLYEQLLIIRFNLEVYGPSYPLEKELRTGFLIDSLKRHMGVKYSDAVAACLSQELDEIWDEQRKFESPDARLRCFLSEVQTKIVDVIAACSA